MSTPETYEVFAIRYGTMQNRTRADNFIMTDDHAASMPIDYFIWAIRNENRTIVVDTGFERKEASKRGREIMCLPAEGLASMGIDAAKVEDVVLTHLHYDHAGTTGDFPGARFHMQAKEMQYATGPCMCHAPLGHAYAADYVCDVVRHVFDGRVRFHDGASELAPGISLHHVGGHTMGLQCVRVLTKRGWVVLASDASHFYENMEKVSPFPVVYNVADMVEAYGTMRKLAESPEHVIPGHDPLVLQRYPVLHDNMPDVVRLDVAPGE